MLTTKALQPIVKRPVAPPAPNKPVPAAAGAGSPAPSPVRQDSQQNNPVRTLSYYFGLAFVFTVVGILPELTAYVTGLNTRLIYWVAPPAILGALFTGGIRRTLQHRTAWYWIAFFVWMAVGIPFSYWKGGSVNSFWDYSRVAMPLLFVLAGLATNWKEIRGILYTIGMAGLLNLITARIFAKNVNGRISMGDASGTIGNSNDLAAHLLFVLPFVIFIFLDRKRNAFLRYSLLPLMAYGIWVIVGTASRGALIALAAMFLFILLRSTLKQAVLTIIVGILLVGAGMAILPGTTLGRLATLFGQEQIEADESADSRGYLFRTSLRYTAQHPITGVGLGQFSTFEGNESRSAGKHGNWHETHCSWTQISAECGLPALFFAILGIGSALMLVYRTWRRALARGFTEIANACFCYLLAMTGFLVAITFLANAYRFYLPAMIGLAISMSFTAMRHMSANTRGTQNVPGIIARQPLAVR